MDAEEETQREGLNAGAEAAELRDFSL